MTSTEIRNTFLGFFRSKQHEIVGSAPMVVKNDPTLMFTNAGMNQFKDYFLGNSTPPFRRIANTQKCLRVSGKHNDLEEVGIDTYHHTMFEMLGNWSFGDYFKKEAIAWSWELLTEVYKIPADRLYVTVFEGDKKENLSMDSESYDCWKKHIAEDRILKGNKKDNFWEMGETGPCGPCSEIHADIRNDEERKKTDGKELVNTGHPQVIEIWNNVFMEFNRKADGTLENLPARHVDTGMGFERLCMVLQGKTSNYDTDVFQPLIQYIAARCGKTYGLSEKTDIAMRVMADHVRAITCGIADGQLPSNNKAGYVLRRILRRAVRYGFTFLEIKQPFLSHLVPVLAEQFSVVFPEVKAQQDFIARVIQEEEQAFLRTLEVGISKFEGHSGNIISGEFAFELYDTYGFPIDLTELMARERNMKVDMDGFNRCLQQQKERSRSAAAVDTGDWVVLKDDADPQFVGYEKLACKTTILRYRQLKTKNKTQYQVVLSQTPFYSESGGQVGDTGTLSGSGETISILDTQKENNLVIHLAETLPSNPQSEFVAQVDENRRKKIMLNHSATHLMHAALKAVLGAHVSQKGSLVNEEYTRFDFSHFAKVSDEEIEKIEQLVNEKIREDIALDEKRQVPVKEALTMGATALFGEKYGDRVRVISFDPKFSMELCGGTHVASTGRIGMFKIISEGAIAAGVRRIEAITGSNAETYFRNQEKELMQVKDLLNNPKEVIKSVTALVEDNNQLRKRIEELLLEKAASLKSELIGKMKPVNGINLIAEKIDLSSAEIIKTMLFEMRQQVERAVICVGSEIDGKAHLSLIIADELIQQKKLDASRLIREVAREVEGGGGGQPFFATAGGKNPAGINEALKKLTSLLS